MKPVECFVTTLIPFSGDAGRAVEYAGTVSEVLSSHYAHHEILLIEDGVDAESDAVLEPFLQRVDFVRVLRLSRAHGFETALQAGLESAIGDFVVITRVAYDPPELIPTLVDLAREGHDVVTGRIEAQGREARGTRLARRLYYAYLNRVLKLAMQPGLSDFRVLSRRMVNSLVRIKDRHRSIRMYGALLGFKQVYVPYVPLDPEKNFRGFWNRVNVGVNVIVANSTNPLRLVSLLGILAAGLNLLYALYVIVIYLVKKDVAPGWATLSLTMSSMFFLLFVSLAVISEYVGRILMENHNRPAYFLLDEKNSNVVLDEDAMKNVIDESLQDAADA